MEEHFRTSQEETTNFKSLIKQKLSGNQQKLSPTKSHKVCGSHVSTDSQAIASILKPFV